MSSWTRNRKVFALAGGLAVAGLLAPGWRGSLERVDHDVVLNRARRQSAGGVFGVSRPGASAGEEWHATYMGRAVPSLLRRIGLRGALLRVAAPDFVAHIPAGAERADGYYRVVTEAHWPWWRGGGGVDWKPSAE